MTPLTSFIIGLILGSFIGWRACRLCVRAVIMRFQEHAMNQQTGLGWWHAAEQILERLKII